MGILPYYFIYFQLLIFTINSQEEEAFDMKCRKLIKGDPSYNLAFIPEFESVAYFEYLKNMQINVIIYILYNIKTN